MPVVERITSKPCSKCRVVKPLDEFGAELRRPDGVRCHCKACGAQLSRRHRETSDTYRQWVRRANRPRKLLSKYGLTPDEYDRLLAAQGGSCAICRADSPGGKHDDHFHVDHDHETGKVRGLLCNKCNVALGVFGDNLGGIERVVEYLRRSSSPSFSR